MTSHALVPDVLLEDIIDYNLKMQVFSFLSFFLIYFEGHDIFNLKHSSEDCRKLKPRRKDIPATSTNMSSRSL